MIVTAADTPGFLAELSCDLSNWVGEDELKGALDACLILADALGVKTPSVVRDLYRIAVAGNYTGTGFGLSHDDFPAFGRSLTAAVPGYSGGGEDIVALIARIAPEMGVLGLQSLADAAWLVALGDTLGRAGWTLDAIADGMIALLENGPAIADRLAAAPELLAELLETGIDMAVIEQLALDVGDRVLEIGTQILVTQIGQFVRLGLDRVDAVLARVFGPAAPFIAALAPLVQAIADRAGIVWAAPQPPVAGQVFGRASGRQGYSRSPMDPAGGRKLRRAVWDILYQGRSITAAIGPFVEQIDYSDELHGKSDELTITVNDADGQWRGPWYPGKGDRISLTFGLEDGGQQPAGVFEVEEIEQEFARDGGATMQIKALSAGITGPMRSEAMQGHEQVTLAQLATLYADKHRLTVVGDIPALKFNRITQHGETDLGFLKRLADENGLCLAVKSDQLVFTSRAGLKGASAVLALGRADIVSGRLRDKTLQTYKAAEVSYSDPATGKTIGVTVNAPGATSGDVHKITDRVENELQARQRAEAALNRLNAGERGGSLKLPGDPRIAAGVKLVLKGDFGRMAGEYLVEKARHRFSPGDGYSTEVELKTP